MAINIQAENYCSYSIFDNSVSFHYSWYDNCDPGHHNSSSHSLENQGKNTASATSTEGSIKEPPPTFLKRILIVDDDPDITLALSTVLEDNGYTVYVFNDPTDALSNFKQYGIYDLLIIDVVMPNMDGFEFYEKIKKIDNKVKACFITAYDVHSEALREIYPDFEIDCFMKKPIENEDLLRKVMNATLQESPN
jgi:two-component system, OmpR family, response regulator ChvI